MGDYVGVDVGAEVESDAKASWIRVGACVGDLRYSGGVGEAECYWGGGAVEVGGSGEFFSSRGGGEGAVEHQAASVNCV